MRRVLGSDAPHPVERWIVAYVLYVAAEASSAGWIAPQLHRVGFSQSTGAVVTAGFWSGLAVGRVLTRPLSKRLSNHGLVIGGLGLAVALAGVSTVDALAPYSYPLMGLVIALVYPLGLIWYTVLCPHDGDGLALLILTMMFGGVLGPATESFTVSLAGIHAVPFVIATFALLTLATFASALRFTPITLPEAPT